MKVIQMGMYQDRYIENAEVAAKSPRELREMFRTSEWRAPTAGLAPGYVQANVVILPKEQAFDFRWVDILPSPNNNILFTTGQNDVIFLIQPGQISGAKPTVFTKGSPHL